MDYQLSKEELRKTKLSKDEFLKVKQYPIIADAVNNFNTSQLSNYKKRG